MKTLTRRTAMAGLAMAIEFNAGTARKPVMQEAVMMASDVEALRSLFRLVSRKKFDPNRVTPALLAGDINAVKRKTV